MENEYVAVDAATAEAIRRCAGGLTAYASALAVKGMDDIVEDMRWLTVWLAEFWLTDIYGKDWMEIRERYTNSFWQAVTEAVRTGQAPPLTEQMRGDVLKGLEIHARELEEMEDHDQFVDWCRDLCRELPMAWDHDSGHQCRRPDADGFELLLPSQV